VLEDVVPKEDIDKLIKNKKLDMQIAKMAEDVKNGK
jgi:hypothetical protein